MKSKHKIISVSVLLLLSLSLFSSENSLALPMQIKSQVSYSGWINENSYRLNSSTIEIYSGSMAYLDNVSNTYQQIDLHIRNNTNYFYVEKGIYKVYINKNLSSTCLITVYRGNNFICWKPVNTGYIDISTYKMQSLRAFNYSSTITVKDNQLIFNQLFGHGIDLRFIVGTDNLKEELIINHNIISVLPSPSNYDFQENNTFVGIISTFQSNLNISQINKNYTTAEQINLNFNNKFQLGLARNIAFDNNTFITVKNIFIKNNNLKIASGVPYNWIKITNGTVTIDPTVTIQPSSKDNLIRSGLPTTNYGTAINVNVASDVGAADIERVIISFTGIPINVTITSGIFSMYYYTKSANDPVGRTYYTNVMTGSCAINWTETGSTWNKCNAANSWITVGGDFSPTNRASSTVPASFRWMNWTVTSMIQSYSTNGTSTVNLLVKDNTEASALSYTAQFYSKDYGVDITKRPKLVIVYILSTYLITNIHSGISSLYVNGSSKANGTSTAFTYNQIANITSIINLGYTFLYYKVNSTYYSLNNPLYWTMNTNYTINAYAYPITTVTTTGKQVLPNNSIPNLFYIGVFAGTIFLLGLVAVVLRRRN